MVNRVENIPHHIFKSDEISQGTLGIVSHNFSRIRELIPLKPGRQDIVITRTVLTTYTRQRRRLCVHNLDGFIGLRGISSDFLDQRGLIRGGYVIKKRRRIIRGTPRAAIHIGLWIRAMAKARTTVGNQEIIAVIPERLIRGYFLSHPSKIGLGVQQSRQNRLKQEQKALLPLEHIRKMPFELKRHFEPFLKLFIYKIG
jgi:hypothetical protein